MSIIFHLLLLACLTASLASAQSYGKRFSYAISVDSMTRLIPVERELYNNLNAYSDRLEAKLKVIRLALAQMRPVLEQAEAQPEQYMGNPLQAYSLLRQMEHDWHNWMDYMRQPVGVEEMKAIKSQHQFLPVQEDMVEASYGMSIIEEMYILKPQNIAAGLLQDTQYNASLSAVDCWSIGQYYYDSDRFELSTKWLKVAHQRYDETQRDIYEILGFSHVELYQLISNSLMEQNLTDEALATIDSALDQLNPLQLRLISHRNKLKGRFEKPSTDFKDRSAPPVNDVDRVCRTDYEWVSRLHCRYSNNGSPYHRLAPFKIEEVLIDPYMVLYHDVISTSEMEQLKNYARLKLKPDERRSAKHSLLPNDIPLVDKLQQRLANITGLSMELGGELQVSNYGLGGFIGDRRDLFTGQRTEDDNPYATALIYLSDVSQGGATAFDELELAIKPMAGMVLVFYNLLDSLEDDLRTKYFSCPVLGGNKWVATKWISAKAQTLKGTCTEQHTAY